MKQSPSERELLRNLGPSKFSAEGFLGEDTRPLDEIISEDLRAIERTGVSLAELANSLRQVYTLARQALGGEFEVRPGVAAVFHDSRGRIPSPFRGGGTFEKGEAVVTDRASGRRLILTSLGLALIERHGFFQGRGSRYRIDPAEAVALLGLAGR